MQNDILTFQKLTNISLRFDRLNQITWTVAQARKRYTYPEGMTKEEMEQLIKFYLGLIPEVVSCANDLSEIPSSI